ncbi:MAG: DUF192 domain-containing protein [Rubricoccaceae bacterium]
MRIFLVCLLLTLAACEPDAVEPSSTATSSASRSIPFRIDGRLAFVRGTDTLKVIDIEVADTDSSRARGLMERAEIPEDTGMLFIFPQEAPQAFYMMNTPRSLDIQFYSADSTLVNIGYDTEPFSLDNVYSNGPAQFVVEVAAGVSRSLGLVPGDRITWELTR